MDPVEGLPPGAEITEEWRVVDRWWTEVPTEYRWREIVLADERRVTQLLEEEVWREYVRPVHHGPNL